MFIFLHLKGYYKYPYLTPLAIVFAYFCEELLKTSGQEVGLNKNYINIYI